MPADQRSQPTRPPHDRHVSTLRRSALIAGPVLVLCGCVQVTPVEQIALNEIEAQGYSPTTVQEVSPTAAGLLSILPGGGEFYIAASTDDDRFWWYGAGNLITWPLSILWGVPQSSTDANRINRKATADLYMRRGFNGLDEAMLE